MLESNPSAVIGDDVAWAGSPGPAQNMQHLHCLQSDKLIHSLTSIVSYAVNPSA